MEPLVSVVIPTYNHAHFLKRSVQSVLDQSYPNFEVIVIDNNSSDNTKTILDEFADKRIKYFLIDNNGSIAASRNKGIRNSYGSWIAFLDSDDYWCKGKLEALFGSELRADDFDAICHNVATVDVNGELIRDMVCGPVTNNFYYDLLLTGNRCSTSAIAVKASFLSSAKLSFNESTDFITAEDYGLWLDMARLGARFKFVNKTLSKYVIHSDNNSSKTLFHFGNCKNLLSYHVFTLCEFPDELDKLWKAIKVRIKIQIGVAYFRQGQYLKGIYSTVYASFISPRYFAIFLFTKLRLKVHKHK